MLFQFRPGRSFFHRLDPASKFIWLACVSYICLRFEDAWIQAAALLAVAFMSYAAAGLPPAAVWRGVRLPFWVGVPYFFLQLLVLPGETTLLAVGPLAITAEALDYAAAVSMRLLTLVLGSLLFIATTDPRDAVLALTQQLRVPYRFAFAVSIALRFLPILEAEAAAVRSALRLRGGHAAGGGRGSSFGVRERAQAQLRFAFAVFVGAVRRVQQIAETMESRAFGLYPDRTYRRRLRVSPAGVGLSIVSALVVASSVLWR